jgi:hypothetical protein
MEFIQQFFDHQNRKLALHRVLIEGPVIHAKEPRFIIFLNQEHQRRKSRGAGADDATVPHGHTLPFKLDLLHVCISIWPHRNRCHAGKKVDVMGPVLVWRQPTGLLEQRGELQ